MLEHKKLRNLGGKCALPKLKEAVELSTPSICSCKECVLQSKDSCGLTRSCTKTQRYMCFNKLNFICTVYKIEAAIAARRFNYTEALEKRRAASIINTRLKNSGLCTANLLPSVTKNQNYLDYWLYITEGSVALDSGDFGEARKHFNMVQKISRDLDTPYCFPNYFINLREVREYGKYIDALENFKNAQFGEAGGCFANWLEVVQESNNVFGRDNTRCFIDICEILELMAAAGDTATIERKQRALEVRFRSLYVGRTTWALWRKLKTFWILSKSQTNSPAEPRSFAEENWRLLNFATVLLGEDREAGLNRHIIRHSFYDIDQEIEGVHFPYWKQLLMQDIKHFFLNLADYELARSGTSSSDRECSHLESLTTGDIIELVEKKLEARSSKKLEIYRDALVSYNEFNSSIDGSDFNSAVIARQDLFDAIIHPHVVRVTDQKKIGNSEQDEGDRAFLINRTVFQRFRDHDQELTIEGPQNLEIGKFYYMRAGRNLLMGDLKRKLHEQFWKTDIPGSVNVFYENLTGRGITNREQFCKWILQFDDTERLLACKLLGAMTYYDYDKMKGLFAIALNKMPEATRLDFGVAALGHQGKSGTMMPYFARQIMTSWPGYESSLKEKIKVTFRPLSDYELPELKLTKPENFIFLDDIIGTGSQTKSFFEWNYNTYAWLNEKKVFYCAAMGFRKPIEEIQSCFREKGLNFEIICGKILEEGDRAFSRDNPLWSSAEECAHAEKWAQNIGRELLENYPDPYKKDKDALGWRGCQALITFFYNIPSNTLPIFWAEGQRNGDDWTYLFKRHD